MSCKRVPRGNRKGRGRIKYNYDDLNKFSFDKVNSDTRPADSKIVLQEDNQDVETTRNGESSNEFEIITSTFSLPNQAEMVQDITSVNVDEWFKQRTESVSSIDLDVVMKNGVENDEIDTTYLTDNITSNNFLNTGSKDVDMTYIVTNMCDIGLGLDLPTNTSKPKIRTETYIEKDCDILNNYSANQDPMLNHLNRTELLDKEMLDENTGINNSQKVEFLESEKQGLFYVIGVNEGQCVSVDSASTTGPNKKDNKGFKENLWNGSVISEGQPSLEGNKDKSNWESFSTTNKKIMDTESDKEIDFPEFNLIALQVGSTDGVYNIAQLPQIPIEFVNGELAPALTVPSTSNQPNDASSENISNKDPPGSKSEPDKNANPGTSKKTDDNPATPIKNAVSASTHPHSLLRSRLTAPITTKRPSILRRPEENKSAATETSQENEKISPKKSSSLAIIAISTDKSKNMTEIIINTPFGEQVFRGKTTDLMKATAGLWQKQDNNKHKSEQSVMINMDTSTEASASPTIPDVQGEMADDIEDIAPEEEQPVTEALAELGINLENSNIGLTVVAGNKVWLCPFKGCGKMYQRQCMLKVHILSHFNVRPYRCNVPGCHWSFYTFFKLKRHKETHLKKKDFMCTIQGCNRRFTTVYNLNAHQKLHERPLEMICPVEACASRFQTKRSLELHMKSHDKQHAPYLCSYERCGKHYYSLNALNSHLRSHQHKDEDVRCQWEGCGKLFDKPCRLKAHMRSHTGDKPYPCKYKGCGWAFPSASKLKRHQHKHTNERKFQCEVEGCGKSFMRSEHLKEHALTHAGHRNFQCPFENCGVKFSAKSSLYVHLKKHGKPDSSLNRVVYHCPIEQCVRTYTCKSSLRQHMLKFHTPVLASDPSQLDHITLLAGDDDLTTLEGLQFSGEITTGALNTVSLVTNPSVLMQSDGVSSVTPEFVTTDFQFPALIPAQVCTSGSSSTSLNNSVITHVLLAPPEAHSTTLPAPNPVETSADSGTTADQPLNMSLFEPEVSVIETDKTATQGSARTSYTYQDIMKERERKKANASPIPTTSMGMRAPADVVLGTGLSDIPHSLLLQDDLSTNNHTLYSEDHMMAVCPGVGEFQVLLLDPSSRHEFAESTINLRDLE